VSVDRRKAASRLALLAGTLLLLAWALQYRLTSSESRYEHQLRAAGEKLSIEELWPPAARPESNGAALFKETIAAWNNGGFLESNAPVAMSLVAPGKAVVAWAQPDARLDHVVAWQDVEEALSRCRDDLEEVRLAAQRPVLDFKLDYREGPSLLIPHLAPLKKAAQRLVTAELCDLHEGDVARAVTNVEVMLELANAMMQERLAISQLIRMAMAQQAMAATWELLQATNLSDQQLAAIQGDWTGVHFLEPAHDAIAMDRAIDKMALEKMRSSSAEFQQFDSRYGTSGSRPSSGSFLWELMQELTTGLKARTRAARWRFGASYPDELCMLKGFQAVLEEYREVRSGRPYAPVLAQQSSRLASLGLTPTKDELSGENLRGFVSVGVVASLSGILNRVFVAETEREMAITALALKRYQLAHGRYPAELSALLPQFIDVLPKDLADGQPLRYGLRPDGTFLLYSIGEDGKDDGGDGSMATQSVSLIWQKGRDLVWPLPATLEEITAHERTKVSKAAPARP